MKWLTAAAALTACSFALLFAYGTENPSPQNQNKLPTKEHVDAFMRAKLVHGRGVLKGLTLEDYDAIAKHAQQISLLSLESNWNVISTPEYVRRSREFRQTSHDLAEAAKKKNLDGATLAYVKMTFDCVNCHKYLRSFRAPGERTPELRDRK
jgi:hypothetical protein